MITKFSKTFIFAVVSFFILLQNGLAERKLQATSQVYADLKNDDYAIRVIDAYLRLYQKGDSPICNPGDKEAMIWLANQKKQHPLKVEQIAMQILKREKDLNCKSFMVQVLADDTNTDKVALIEEIHNQFKQLPRSEDSSIRADGWGFLTASAIVLSTIGTVEDRPILTQLSSSWGEFLFPLNR